MPSVGIMASGVTVAAGVDVLFENFANVADWTGTITSVTGGRTGRAGQITGSSNAVTTIPAPSEDATVTFGFAFKISSLAATRRIFDLDSDSGGTTHTIFQVTITGAIEARLGTISGTLLGTTAAGVVAINTWNYFEAQVVLHDTAGALKMRVNNTELVNLSGIDTRFAGSKTVFDTVRLRGGGTSQTHTFDDLYLTTGAGAPFKGDITVPETAYLTPTVGVVTTPDPGVVPRESVLVARVRPVNLNGVGTDQTWAGQWDSAADRSFVIYTTENFNFSYGVYAGASPAVIYFNAPPPVGTVASNDADTYLGVTMALDPVAAGKGRIAIIKSTDGVTWAESGSPMLPGTIGAVFDATTLLRIGTRSTSNTQRWLGRIYWMEMRSGLDPTPAKVNAIFPALAGNYFSSPSSVSLVGTTLEIVARVSAPWTTGIGPTGYANIVGRRTGVIDFLFRIANQSRLNVAWRDGAAAVQQITSNYVTGVADGTVLWVRVRVDATTVTFDTAPDSPYEPTTWTPLGSSQARPGPSTWTHVAGSPITIGDIPAATPGPWNGRIARVIVRDSIAATTPALDYDDHLIPAVDATSFPALVGGTLTVTQTGGLLVAVASNLLWRFDANDYPGSGTSYVDPRGRTWTLTSASAITPSP